MALLAKLGRQPRPLLSRRADVTVAANRWQQPAVHSRGTRLGTAAATPSPLPAGAEPGKQEGTAAEASATSRAGPTAAEAAAVSAEVPKRNLWQKVKHFFVGDKLDKERLASLGMGAVASYGVISNVTYGTCVVIAWLSFVKATGQSPLAPGQWTGFLGFYAGLWMFQNFVRPLRFGLAVALAPLFNTFIERIALATGLDKKWAFGVLLVGIAACTFSVLFSVLYLGGGFPPQAA